VEKRKKPWLPEVVLGEELKTRQINESIFVDFIPDKRRFYPKGAVIHPAQGISLVVPHKS
jgi:hypothetical protein